MGNRETALKNLAKGTPTGRPKGSNNKFTDLKRLFVEAFKEVGGKEYLVKFAKEPVNRSDFLKMIAKMLPTNVVVDQKAPLMIEVTKWPKSIKLKKKILKTPKKK